MASALTGEARYKTLKAVYFGLLAGLAVFTTVFVVLSAILGSGVIAVVTGALLEGDASALQFKVFTLLFNFSDGELIGKGDADFQGTALRNTLVGVFVVTSVYFGLEHKMRYRVVSWEHPTQPLRSHCSVVSSLSQASVAAIF